MTEGYTDEELLHCTWLDSNLFHAFQRLQRERDEARRVARGLALSAVVAHWLSPEEMTLVRIGRSYPEEKP